MGVDNALVQFSLAMFLFFGVISKHELSMDVLIQGQISGLLFVAGTITQIVALTTGPGGPI